MYYKCWLHTDKKKTIQILKSKRGQINEKHKTAYFFRQGIKTYCWQSLFAEIEVEQFPVINILLPVGFNIWSSKCRTLGYQSQINH